MGDLGDISKFMSGDSGLGDRKWLSVDPTEYRATDTLPKQNLDTVPDLKALWSHQDQPSTSYLIPNNGAPRTMGDMSQAHGALRAQPSDIVRVARLALMQTQSTPRVTAALQTRFDTSAILAAKTALANVMAEQGLLGKYYIDASDFLGCDNSGSKKASEFAKKYANDAFFVRAKTACADCIHRNRLADGTDHCGVFRKEIRLKVPYTEQLAEYVEQNQRRLGRYVEAAQKGKAASEDELKARIQKAFLAPVVKAEAGFTGRSQPQPPRVKMASGDPATMLIAVENLTKKREINAAEMKARPIVALLRREMLKGRTADELIGALRLSFDLRDLRDTRAHWEPLFREAGLYGTIYTTQESFDECREGADFLAKHSSKIRAVVRGPKCGSCIFNQASRCLMYGKKLASTPEDTLTPEVVRYVVEEHKLLGSLPYTADKISWGETPREALKAIYKEAASKGLPVNAFTRMTVETAFAGAPVRSGTSELTRREIVRTASKYLNEGLYGEDLATALKSRFDVRDLNAAQADLKPVLAEQGLQGIYYVDPSIYEDYGKGCKQAASLHRSRLVPYVKIKSACVSCIHRSNPGHCSVINKPLVQEPPYTNKLAQQQSILNSGASTEVSYGSLMNNGLSMMQEYQLQAGDGNVDLNQQVERPEFSIEFGAHEVKL